MVFIFLFINFMRIVTWKSPKTSSKIISSFVIFIFICYKTIHIPIFMSTIPFFNFEIPYFYIILGVLTWTNLILAGFPLLASVYSALVNSYISKEKLQQSATKDIFIIMPIYNENPKSLYKAIQSVQELQYDLKRIHLFLAFDDDQYPDAYNYLIEQYELQEQKEKKIIIIDIEGLKIYICRFKHGGKKSAQHGAFQLIEQFNSESLLKDSLIFLIDSDIQLKSDSLMQFTYYMQRYKRQCLTGLITCVNSENPNFLTFYQDIEYISGQLFWRNMENFFGASTCLPGAFTILTYEIFKHVSEQYFTKHTYSDVYDYHRFYLGEDRYLTHLIMENKPWSIGFCENARCKTDAPNTLHSLLKQRRRWYLGHISNDTWMMSSMVLWRYYPLLSIFNFLNNARNTSIYIYLIYFILLLNKEVSFTMWFVFIILPMLLNWLFIGLYSFKIRRHMNILFYFTILAFQPIFNMMYMYYTIYTLRDRTWGGVRVEQKDITERKREQDENDSTLTLTSGDQSNNV